MYASETIFQVIAQQESVHVINGLERVFFHRHKYNFGFIFSSPPFYTVIQIGCDFSAPSVRIVTGKELLLCSID